MSIVRRHPGLSLLSLSFLATLPSCFGGGGTTGGSASSPSGDGSGSTGGFTNNGGGKNGVSPKPLVYNFSMNSPIENPTASGGLAVAVEDLNKDSILDLAWLNSTDLKVYLGVGNGTFGAAQSLAFGASFGAAQAALLVQDLNNDGYPDLAAGGAGPRIDVWFNNKNGTFALAVEYTVGATPKSVAAGKINSDAHLDLISCNDTAGNAKVSVLPSTGSGVWGTEYVLTDTSNRPLYLAVEDYDEDGRFDVVGVDNANSKVIYYGNNKNDTTLLKAGVTTTLTVATSPGVPLIEDWDNDGFIDLVFPGSTKLASLKGLGTGGFTEAQVGSTLASGTFASLSPFGTEKGFVAYVQGAAGADESTKKYTHTASTMTFALSFTEQAGNATLPAASRGTSGDFNGDGTTDIGIPDTGGNSFVVHLGNGENSFLNGIATLGFSGGNPSALQGDPVSFTIEALTSYGGPAAAGVAYAKDNANGTYTPVAPISTNGQAVKHLFSADLDGDGDGDLVASVPADSNKIHVLRQNGTSFNTITTLTAGTNPVMSVAANLDGDASLDIVAINKDSNNFSVFLDFAGAATNVATGTAPVWAAFADKDADNDLDLYTLNTSQGVTSHLNNGAGTFAAGVQEFGVGLAGTLLALFLVDLNSNGVKDAIYATNSGAAYRLKDSSGWGAEVPLAGFVNKAVSLAVSDMNGDGLQDILALTDDTATANTTGQLLIWLSPGGKGAFYVNPVATKVGLDPKGMFVGNVGLSNANPDVGIALSDGTLLLFDNLSKALQY